MTTSHANNGSNHYVIGKHGSMVCMAIGSRHFKTTRPRSLDDIDLGNPEGLNLYRAVQFLTRVFENPNIGSTERSLYFMNSEGRIVPKVTFILEPLFRSPVGVAVLRKFHKKLHQLLLEDNYPELYRALEEYNSMVGGGEDSYEVGQHMSAYDLTHLDCYSFHSGAGMGGGQAGSAHRGPEERRLGELARKCMDGLEKISTPYTSYKHVGDDVEMRRMTREFWSRYNDEEPGHYMPEDDTQSAFLSEFGDEELRSAQRLCSTVHEIGMQDLLHEENFAGVRPIWIVNDPEYDVMKAIQSLIFSNAARMIGHHLNASRKGNMRVDSRAFSSIDIGAFYNGASQFGSNMLPMITMPKKKRKRKQTPKRSFLQDNPADPRPSHDSGDEDEDYDADMFGPADDNEIPRASAAASTALVQRSVAEEEFEDDDDDDDEFTVSFIEAEKAISAHGPVTNPDEFSDTICTYRSFAENVVNVLLPEDYPNSDKRRVKITDELKTEGYDIYSMDRENKLRLGNWVMGGIWCWTAKNEPVCTVQTTLSNYLREDTSSRTGAEYGNDTNAPDDDDDDEEEVDVFAQTDSRLNVVGGTETALQEVRSKKAVFSLPFPDVPRMELKPEDASWDKLKSRPFPWSATSRFDIQASLLETWEVQLRGMKEKRRLTTDRRRVDVNTSSENNSLRILNEMRSKMIGESSSTKYASASANKRLAAIIREQTVASIAEITLDDMNDTQDESDDLERLRVANQRNYRRLKRLQNVEEFKPYMFNLMKAYRDMTIDDFTLVYSKGKDLSRSIKMQLAWQAFHPSMATDFPTLDPQLGRIGSVYSKRILFFRHSLRQALIMEAFNEALYTVYGVYSMPNTDREELGSAYKSHFGNLGPSGLSKSYLTTCIKNVMINGTIDRRDSMSDGAHVSENHMDQVMVFDEAPAFLVGNSRSLSSVDYNRAQNFKVMMSEQELAHSTTKYDPKTNEKMGCTVQKNVGIVVIFNTNRLDTSKDKSTQNRFHIHTATGERDDSYKIAEVVGRTTDADDEETNEYVRDYLRREQFVVCTVFKMLGTRTIPVYPEISLVILYWNKAMSALSQDDKHVFDAVRALQRAIRSGLVRTIADAHDLVHNTEVSPALMRNTTTGEMMYQSYSHRKLERMITPGLFAREETVISDITAQLSQFYDPVVWEVLCYAAQSMAGFKFEVPEHLLKKVVASKNPKVARAKLLGQISEMGRGDQGGAAYMDMFEAEELGLFPDHQTIHRDRDYFIPYDAKGKPISDNARYRHYEDKSGAHFLDHNWLVIKGHNLKHFANLLANKMKKKGFDEETVSHILDKALNMKFTAQPYEVSPLLSENMRRRGGSSDEDVLPVEMPERVKGKIEFSVLKYIHSSDEESCELHICTHYMRHDPDTKLRKVLNSLRHDKTRERMIVIARPVMNMPQFRMLYYLKKRKGRVFKVSNSLHINDTVSKALYDQQSASAIKRSETRAKPYIEIDGDVEEHFAREHFARIGEEFPGQYDCYLPRVVDDNIREMYKVDPWLRRAGKNISPEQQARVDELTRTLERLPAECSATEWAKQFRVKEGEDPKRAAMEHTARFGQLAQQRTEIGMKIALAKLRYPFVQIDARKKELHDRKKEDEMDFEEDPLALEELARSVVNTEARFGARKHILMKRGIMKKNAGDDEALARLQKSSHDLKVMWQSILGDDNDDDDSPMETPTRKRPLENPSQRQDPKKRRRTSTLANYNKKRTQRNAKIGKSTSVHASAMESQT